MEEQTGNVSKPMNTRRKNEEEMLEIKNTATDMIMSYILYNWLNTSHLLNWRNTAEEKISELKYMTIETSQTEMHKERGIGKIVRKAERIKQKQKTPKERDKEKHDI